MVGNVAILIGDSLNMQATVRPRLCRALSVTSLAAVAALLTACATPKPEATIHKQSRSKEYFAESEYGVKASPRVATGTHGIKRGGGRDQIGKPYKIRGKWYYPKEDKTYSKVGMASWYGDAFHGRLTANGEIYDTQDLTAAHPTMPLPSYARVTDLDNGSSIIVRVNDRGPYHGGRVIDLSKRAAQLLGYAKSGTAKVKVDFVGRAPLEGDDKPYLMASYRPGNRAPDPSDGLPSGVMIAMNGPTPSLSVGQDAAPFPGELRNAPVQTPILATTSLDDVPLPDFGPMIPVRPGFDPTQQAPFALASLSYADERVETASRAFAAFDDTTLSASSIASAWKRDNPVAAIPGSARKYVAAGSFENSDRAVHVAGQLAAFGKTEVETSEHDGKVWYSVNLYSGGHRTLDELLQASWSHGAPDAIAVRD